MKRQLLKLHLPQHGTPMHSYVNTFIYSPPSLLPPPFLPLLSHLPSLTHCREGKMETHTEPPHKNTLLTDLDRMDAGEMEETEVHSQSGITHPLNEEFTNTLGYGLRSI